MAPGTKVYLSWYDFANKTEHICKGEVTDNSDYAGTQWQDWLNVCFQPPSLPAPICHHFMPDKLSLDASNVPHDDCYLLCAKKTRAYDHDYTLRRKATVPSLSSKEVSPSDTWQQVQQFKHDHWDYEHGHLSIDALDAYYDRWRNAIAAKRATATTPADSPSGTTTPDDSPSGIPTTVPSAVVPSLDSEVSPRKQPNIIQLSLF